MLACSSLPSIVLAQDTQPANPWPANCCNYKFTDPSFPLVGLPTEGGDIRLLPTNPLVTVNGAGVQCNGDQLSVWNTDTRSFERTYVNNAGEVKPYDHVLYITASNMLQKSTSQTQDSQMRDALLSGKLVQLALDCGTGETTGQCVQFAITSSPTDSRWNNRPTCLGGPGGEPISGNPLTPTPTTVTGAATTMSSASIMLVASLMAACSAMSYLL